MAERKAVTKTMARRYSKATKAEKGAMLDELCALTGWTRRHARRALAQALAGRIERPRKPRPKIYGEDVLAALRFVWAVLDAPAGKRLAPVMAETVEALERHGEIQLPASVRPKLLQISAASLSHVVESSVLPILDPIPRASSPVPSPTEVPGLAREGFL